MDRMDFNHAVARLRVMEKRLLDKVRIERLIDSETPQEALRILQETAYGESISNTKSVHEYEKFLKEELRNLYKNMYIISPEKSVVNIMALKYDYHNIKVLIKEKFLDKDFSFMIIPCGTIPIDVLKVSITTGDLKALNSIMGEGILRVENEFSKSKDSQVIDIILDKCMFEDMLTRASEMNIDFISQYVKQSIDITNIKTMLRVKKQKKDPKFLETVLLKGGTIEESILLYGLNDTLEAFIAKISKTAYSEVLSSILEGYSSKEDISALDRLFDDYIMNHAKEIKRINFGPEPIIAYILARETEIKVIRIIIVGKINNVPTDVIRERVRELYV